MHLARNLEPSGPMTRCKLILATLVVLAGMPGTGQMLVAQQPESTAPVFKSSVDLVRVSAVVRDKKGRFVNDLTVHDFEVVDGGLTRQISEFRRDESGVSIALLFDVSGSMEARMPNAREAAEHILSWLNEPGDEAAVFTFDTRLEEVTPFTRGLHRLPDRLSTLRTERFLMNCAQRLSKLPHRALQANEFLEWLAPVRAQFRFIVSASPRS